MKVIYSDPIFIFRSYFGENHSDSSLAERQGWIDLERIFEQKPG